MRKKIKNHNIGFKIKTVRKKLNLTQLDLVFELNSFFKKEVIQYTQVDISNIENNRSMSKDKIYALFIYFNNEKNININYFFDSNNDETIFLKIKLI